MLIPQTLAATPGSTGSPMSQIPVRLYLPATPTTPTLPTCRQSPTSLGLTSSKTAPSTPAPAQPADVTPTGRQSKESAQK